MEHYEENKQSNWYQAVMEVIMRANWKEAEVEKKMCDALRELFAEELEEKQSTGILIGIDLAKKVFRLSKENISLDKIAKECGITEAEVKHILE